MLPGPIYSGKDGSRQYETGEPGASSRGARRTMGGFLGAIADAADERNKRDEDLDAKAKKAKELADKYKAQGAAFKVDKDITVKPGYVNDPFTLTTPGRKGFGGVIGGGLGYLVGGPMGAQVGSSIGGMF